MTDTIEIPGMKIDLPDNRHVWVGGYENAVLIELCNSEGQHTRLKLSTEAANALRYLLAMPDEPAEIVKRFIVHMTKAAGEAKDRLQWQEVKPDTLPIAEPQ